MLKTLLIFVAVLACARTGAAQYPTPIQGDVILKDFKFRSGETLPELRLHYRTLGKPERDAQGVVRNAVLIMHGTGGSGAQFIRPSSPAVVWSRRTARCRAILHHPPRWHRPWQIEQAQRRAARTISALRLPRHGGGAVPAADGGTRRESSATGDGHVDGRHAHVAVGRALSRLHGRADAAREPADADLRVAIACGADRDRCDPQRSRVARRQLPEQPPSLRIAQEMLYFMGEQSRAPPGARCRRSRRPTTLDEAWRRIVKTADANDVLYQVESVARLRPGPGPGEDPRAAAGDQLGRRSHQSAGARHPRARDQARAKGRAVVIPLSPETRGHGTHTIAAVWKQYLEELLAASARERHWMPARRW